MYYVPAQQLQQMHNGQPGIQNPEVAHINHMPWPVSKPTEQHKQIHISLNNRNLAQPMSTRATVSEFPYQKRSPLVDVSPFRTGNLGSPTPLQTPPAIKDNILYSCKVIAQLQGGYEIETSNGIVQISVILPEVGEHQEQYAKVQLVSTHGNALAEKFIYNEPFCFKLCSANNEVEGILRKGSNMKHSVEWWNAENQTYTVWRRKGNVTFNLVQVETNSRRNSLSSVCTVSTCQIIPYPIDATTIESDESTMGIRSELLQQRWPVSLNHSSGGHFSQAVNLQSNPNNTFVRESVPKSDEPRDEIFELIKSQCLKNKLLFEKVVAWGIANDPERQNSRCLAKYLSEGRFWVVAHSKDMGQKEGSDDILDDIKGAYQQTSTGVYMQPDPKECGSGVQHRLSKDQQGYWMLERQDLGCERWHLRARQEKNEWWIDFKHNRTQIRVHIIPMSRVLEKMSEEHIENENEIKKSLDFLFTSCNQEKLSKLKGRNLKHHIANLKVKLEKRHALSFGVRIANTAETILQE